MTCAACGGPSIKFVNHARGSHYLCSRCEPEDIPEEKLTPKKFKLPPLGGKR